MNGVPGQPYLLIADTGHNVIKSFDVTRGTLAVLAGNGTSGYVNGALTSAEFNTPTGLEVIPHHYQDTSHNIYWNVVNVSDSGNYVVRYFCTHGPYGSNTGCPQLSGGIVATYAGNHTKGYVNGTLSSSEFAHMAGMHLSSGYGVDAENHAIRGLGSSITTYAGTGVPGYVDGYRTSAQFNGPTRLAWDAASNMYVADAGNHVIRKIDTAGNVTTFAGSGHMGYADGNGTAAKFNFPTGIVYNPNDGAMYVVDHGNNMIRRIDSSGNVTTYAGQKQGGFVNSSLLGS
jgi:hypothetical protein